MENVLEYNKWEDKLWALYDSIFKDASYTIKDGVILGHLHNPVFRHRC